jgi:transposase
LFINQLRVMSNTVLGIDISKRKFDVCLLIGQKEYHKQFDNSPQGFSRLQRMLNSHDATDVHACMEATGSYGDALARYLHSNGIRVSVVNPMRPHNYGKSRMQRTKSDKADARVIALFCRDQRPNAWEPPPVEVLELQGLLRHYAVLLENRQQHANRLNETQQPVIVQQSLQTLIAALDAEIVALKKLIRKHVDQHPHLRDETDLLISIPGIGELTASKLLAEIVDFRRYSSARKVVGYSGLCTAKRQSGTSLRSSGTMSRVGNARLRKALYMSALVAIRCSPQIKDFADRLRAKGKRPKQVIVAVMRKLLTIAYGVLKSRTPYDPNFLLDKA